MTDAEEKLNKIREGARKGGLAKTKKGFAAMSPKRHREIAAMGGKAKKANHDISKDI